MNISDIMWIKPTQKSIPMYDWCNRSYVPFDDYCLWASWCIDCSFVLTQLQSSDVSILIQPAVCSIWIEPTIMNSMIHLVLNGQNLEIADDILDLSWLYVNFMFNVFDWHNSFPIHMWSVVNIQAIDWMHFSIIWPDTIEIWLPTPPDPYFVPWRCTPWVPTHARWWGTVAGMATWVVLRADIAGSVGNITLTFNWVLDIAQTITAWNVANPWNTISVMWWDTAQIPDNWEYITLHWGYDNPTCQETDYMPFNKRLVLTWDQCNLQAVWLPPQCCIQTLAFSWENINLNSWWHFDNWYVCSCWWCVAKTWCDCRPWNNTTVIVPPPQPLVSINTDNQELTLTDDCPNSQMLCLSRWHWWTLWVQIPDPDSCVDLIEINSHTLSLQGNLLYLLWSDWLVNSIANLIHVNEHTIDIVWNLLTIYGSDWLQNSQVNLWSVNEHTRQLIWNVLSLIWSDGLINDQVDLWNINEHILWRVSTDVLWIYWSDWVLNNSVNLEDVAEQILTIEWWNLCVQKGEDPIPHCTTCKQQCIDLSRIDYTCDDVMDCVCSECIDRLAEWVSPDPLPDACSYVPPLPAWVIPCASRWVWPTWSAQVYMKNQRVIYNGKRYAATADTTAWDVPWVAAVRWIISNSLRPNDARETFFSECRSVWQVLAFLQSVTWWALTNPCWWCACAVEWTLPIPPITKFITRQKYRAVISMRNPLNDWSGISNWTMWSQHTDYIDVEPNDPLGPILHYNSPRNQRWFIPKFDKSQWRHSSSSSMVSTDWIPWSPFEHHNEIAISNGNNWVLSIPDIWFTYTFGTTYYHVDPSENNPNTINESNFAWWWSKTITIVKDWFYQVSLQWVLQADHNVHAFRYSCIRYNSHTWKLELVVDSKFWWWTAVGSSSLNDPLVPRTNEYHWWGTKILLLYAWDILFPAVKISPQTIWPKQQNSAATKDVLHEIDENVSPVYGEHSAWSASWLYVSWTPGHVTWNFDVAHGWQSIWTDEFWRPAANLPNVIPHFFTPSWGMDGAENYWWNLLYAGWYNAWGWDDYRYDDWVLTLYWPSTWRNSDWSWWEEYWAWSWATLAVHRVTNRQWDEEDYIPAP